MLHPLKYSAVWGTYHSTKLLGKRRRRDYSTVEYSTVQYITVQYSTVQYSTVQYSKVQYSTVQYSTVQSFQIPLYHTIQISIRIRFIRLPGTSRRRIFSDAYVIYNIDILIPFRSPHDELDAI